MVSYLEQSSVEVNAGGREGHSYPSFGSLIVFKLMYSSYSNSPCQKRSVSHSKQASDFLTVELWVIPVKRQLRLEEEDIFTNKRTVS
jgi:hypothetical protein